MHSRIKELLSNQHWMIHDLVDGDQIENDDEFILYDLAKDAEKELSDFIFVVRDVMKSYEFYSSQNKPEIEWDEYDYMMYPKWSSLREIMDKLDPPKG